MPWKSNCGSIINYWGSLGTKYPFIWDVPISVRIWNFLFVKQNVPGSSQTVPHCFRILYQPCREGILRFPGKNSGNSSPGYCVTASPNFRPVQLPVLWNFLWNIRDLLPDDKMKYSSSPFGSVCRGNPSECLLAFPSPSPHWQLLHCSGILNLLPKDAMKDDLNQVFQSIWATWEMKDKCYLYFQLLWAEVPHHTQERITRGDDELWPFCFGFTLSPAALEVVVKSLQLCLQPLLPF